MLKIRLQRFGRKHEPVFRVVLTDSQNSTKSGKFKESLGSYDARRGEQSSVKEDRIKYWISKGAQLSDTVHNLLISKKLIEGKKVNSLPKKKAIVKEAPVEETKAEAPVESVVETPTPAEAPVEEPKEEVKEESTPQEKTEETPA